MNKYTKYVSLEHLNNGEPTLAVDVTNHTITLDKGTEIINGQVIQVRDRKYYLSGEAVDRFHELEELATPKKGVWEYDNFGDGTLCCPNCKKPIVNVWSKADYKPNYCHYCGQALDWSDVK